MSELRTIPYYACKHDIPGGCAWCNAVEHGLKSDALLLARSVAAHFADTDAPLGILAREFIDKATKS